MTAKKDVFVQVWDQPDTAFPDVSVRETYKLISAELRKQLYRRQANVLDTMLAERAAFFYAHVRQVETGGPDAAYANDRARKETNAMLIQLVENLQRRWLREDTQDANELLRSRLVSAVDRAMLDIDPTIAHEVREAMYRELEDV